MQYIYHGPYTARCGHSQRMINDMDKLEMCWGSWFNRSVAFCEWISSVAREWHYSDVIMSAIASQITSLAIVYSTVYSGANQRKHQSSASLAFVRGIRRWPVKSQHKGPATRKMLPFDDVIMQYRLIWANWNNQPRCKMIDHLKHSTPLWFHTPL